MEQAAPPSSTGLSRPASGTNGFSMPAEKDPMTRIPGVTGVLEPPAYRKSRTSWTSMGSDIDDPFTDRAGGAALPQHDLFLQEYNQLAEKHGCRPLLFGGAGNGEQDGLSFQDGQMGDRRNWFARTFGRPSAPTSRRSSRHSVGSRQDKSTKHSRSDSDPTNQPHITNSSKPDTADTLKNQTLDTLVRTCGKSFLYLPDEYATRSLMLPTCFRAAAQYLVQNGPEARGIFRISGSMRVVNELYDYYCVNFDEEEDIAATVRSPNLPFHIKAGVHDVASMFKRLLAGLPGGILGYLTLFETLVDIQKAEGQSSNGRLGTFGASTSDHIQSKARLVALAIGSVPSPLRRELICAVFGLLSLIGSAAEAPSASTHIAPGESLQHSERMGCAALGIIFGPLLMGDHLDSYLPESLNDSYFPPAPLAGTSYPNTPSPRSKAEKRRKSVASDKNPLSSLPSALDKILLANSITEMLITNWQDVVHQMKHIGIMRKESVLQHSQQKHPVPLSRALRPTRSETFADKNMGAMVQQAAQPHTLQLRKARSASNNRSPIGSTSAMQPLHSVPWQRPTDMTFEEYAARKKLRNHPSSMSIASDSTYSAIEPLPVKPLSPQPEDTLFGSDPKVTSSRSSTAKLVKQRRMSSGRTSMFSEKPTSPGKNSPKIPRKAVPSVEEGKSQLSLQISSETALPLYNASPNPAKTTEDNVRLSGSPKKATPRRPFRRLESTGTTPCQSDPPQSKTAALIAKIMNTRQSATPTSTKKSELAEDSRERSGYKTPEKSRKMPDSGIAPMKLDVPSSVKRTPKNTEMATGAHSTVAVNRENQAIDPFVNATPTPKRRWRAQHTPTSANERPHRTPIINSNSGSSMPSVVAHMSESVGKTKPLRRVATKAIPPMTPRQRQQNDLNVECKKFDPFETRSEEQQQTGDCSQEYTTDSADTTASPLSEIKNDARGLVRSHSKSSNISTIPKISSRAVQDQDGACSSNAEAKSPAAGSSVKAIAAMFDSTAWKLSFETLPTSSAQTSPRRTPKLSSDLSQYTSNASPSKSPKHLATARPLSHTPQGQGQAEAEESRNKNHASLQKMTNERRNLRLSKSEERNSRLGRAGQLYANEKCDLSLSVDRKDATDITRRKPFYQPSGGSARSKRPFVSNDSLLDRPNTATPSQSVGNTATISFPVKANPTVHPSQDRISVKALQKLLESTSRECQNWKTRAEAAELRVAELEAILDTSGSIGGKAELEPFESSPVRSNRQPWSWQDLLPTAKPILPSEETPGSTKVGREIGGLTSPRRRRGLQVRGDSDKNDDNMSESSTTTVVVRGRLPNERLLPFSL